MHSTLARSRGTATACSPSHVATQSSLSAAARQVQMHASSTSHSGALAHASVAAAHGSFRAHTTHCCRSRSPEHGPAFRAPGCGRQATHATTNPNSARATQTAMGAIGGAPRPSAPRARLRIDPTGASLWGPRTVRRGRWDAFGITAAQRPGPPSEVASWPVVRDGRWIDAAGLHPIGEPVAEYLPRGVGPTSGSITRERAVHELRPDSCRQRTPTGITRESAAGPQPSRSLSPRAEDAARASPPPDELGRAPRPRSRPSAYEPRRTLSWTTSRGASSRGNGRRSSWARHVPAADFVRRAPLMGCAERGTARLACR